MYTLYGIKNCDTMKKAFAWYKTQAIEYHFHDYKKEGITPELLQLFIDKLGWQALLNNKGMTWRKLDEATRQSLDNEAAAKAFMLTHPAIIKRPILTDGKALLLGFSPESYQQFIEKSCHE